MRFGRRITIFSVQFLIMRKINMNLRNFHQNKIYNEIKKIFFNFIYLFLYENIKSF